MGVALGVRPDLLVCIALLTIMPDRALSTTVPGKLNSTELVSDATPCWQVDEFEVLVECSSCNTILSKWQDVCHPTGHIEKVICKKSKKVVSKSCHYAVREESLFWRFEAMMMSLTALFILVVVKRQRVLDRRASDRVWKQLQSS